VTPMVAGTGIRVAYNGRPVLDGVDLEVGVGEWVGLIGPNGAGKSTLLRARAGTVRTGGTLSLGGRSAARLSRRERSRAVALVPQHPMVPVGMTVIEYAMLGRTPHLGYFATEGPEDLEVVRRVLEDMGLATLAGRTLDALSGGELQRAVLARALAQEPELLLLDEPTTSLDIGRQQDVMDMVDRLRRRGHTVVSAMHDLTIAGQFTDRLLLLSEGRVVAAGRPAEVLTPALILRHYGAKVAVMVDADGGVIVVPDRVLTAPHPDQEDGTATPR
jgi:iron complex transport system ATP-binding protein